MSLLANRTLPTPGKVPTVYFISAASVMITVLLCLLCLCVACCCVILRPSLSADLTLTA